MTTPRRLMAFVLALFLAPQAFAQSAAGVEVEGNCDPEVARALVERYRAHQEDLDESKEGLLKEIKKVPEQSLAQLSSCVDLSWPTMSIQYPTMDQIIRGIAKEAVRRACGVARDAIAEQTSKLRGSFYFNPRIPGVPSYGISSTGTGSGGIGWGKSGAASFGTGTPGATGTGTAPVVNPKNPTGGLYGGGNTPPKP